MTESEQKSEAEVLVQVTVEDAPPTLEGADRFSFDKQFFKGVQGPLYFGHDMVTNKKVVIKEACKSLVANKISESNLPLKSGFLEENEMLLYLSKDKSMPASLCHILGSWEDESSYYIVMEFCDTTLFHYLHVRHGHSIDTDLSPLLAMVHLKANSKESMTLEDVKDTSIEFPKSQTLPVWEQKVRVLFKQLVDGVDWLHSSKKVCHFGLTMENIGIAVFGPTSADKQLKIVDFSSARKCHDGFLCQQRFSSVPFYMSPEQYAQQPYDARANDVFSMGVLLFIMLTGVIPFKKPSVADPVFRSLMKGKASKILEILKIDKEHVSEMAVDVLNKIFKKESERITMEQLKKHDFVALAFKTLTALQFEQSAGGHKLDPQMYDMTVKRKAT